MVAFDPEGMKALIRGRRERGVDRFDEVWEGVYVMSPLADLVHQEVSTLLSSAFVEALKARKPSRVFAGINVSDRPLKWEKNYRCPDVAVFLPGNPAQDRGTHWLGGPDFAVEVMSRYDRSRKKLAFYARVGVRELFLVDRDSWALELYRLVEGDLKLLGTSKLGTSNSLASEVLPVTFRLVAGETRPEIEVVHAEDARRWLA